MQYYFNMSDLHKVINIISFKLHVVKLRGAFQCFIVVVCNYVLTTGQCFTNIGCVVSFTMIGQQLNSVTYE